MKWWRRGRDEEEPEEEIEPEPEEAIGQMLELSSRPHRHKKDEPKDKYAKFRGTKMMEAVAPSGIWVVIKFSDAVEVGGWDDDFKNVQMVKAPTGENAIMDVYTRDLKEHGSYANLMKAKGEDGRYVALDFYTGHRVEAKVTGEWKARLDVAG